MEQHNAPDDEQKTKEPVDTGVTRLDSKNREWTGVGEVMEHNIIGEIPGAADGGCKGNDYWKMKIESALQSLLRDEDKARKKIMERYPNIDRNQN